MDFLKRELAPITAKAWEAIDEEAKKTLTGVLSGRKVVDVEGPKGWDFDAVSEGTLSLADGTPVEGVNYGVREVLPLTEMRVPFTLPMWDLDDIERGAKAVDFTSLQEAARKAALFEDTAVYFGIEDAGIIGMELESDNEPVEMALDDNAIVKAISDAVMTLNARSVSGPYALVCSLKLWQKIVNSAGVYPLKKRIEAIIGNNLVLSSQIEANMLVAVRGGDNELVIGQDFSVGYQSHTNTEVSLYITESFTFRTITPESIVNFKLV